MKRFISMGKIEQFRTVIKDIAHITRNKIDDNNEPYFDRHIKLPTLIFEGFEKVHGSNAAISYNNIDKEWYQSRKNIITIEKDNAGCSVFSEKRKKYFIEIIKKLALDNNIDLDKQGIALFFEFAGGNIQKNACVSGLDKMAFIFSFAKVYDIFDVEVPNYWIKTTVPNNIELYNDNSIYFVGQFGSKSIEIDFNKPKDIQNKLIELTKSIEDNSIIAKHFNKEDNIGEGIVFTTFYNDVLYRFKSKGEKHSKNTGKVRTLKPIDEVREKVKYDFVNNIACISWRLEQAVNEVCDIINGGEPDVKQTGDIIRWVINDVMEEEKDIIIEKELTAKEINPLISKIVVEYFRNYLDERVM